MKAKKWIKIFILGAIFTTCFIGIFNFTIDPLWTFSHTNKFNNKQDGFDERQQKTNYLYNKGLENYDGILLGSSRATFINQEDFSNMNIYNYSSAALLPTEYKGYIDFAKKIKGKDLKYIIIGSDFFGTNELKKKVLDSEFYIKNTENIFYKYKMLLSIHTFKKSIRTIENSILGNEQYYDRNNIKYYTKVSEEERIRRFNRNIKKHILELNKDSYKYNNEYINILKEIKENNPNTKFIIFTSAITADLLVSIVKNAEREKEYERWLKELVDVFGEVEHFMTVNTITRNLQNYPDDDHAYPSIVKLIANKLSNTKNNEIPEDFGILLTKENIDLNLVKIKKQIEDFNPNIDEFISKHEEK